MAYSAPRLSSASAYGRLLPLYAAALSTPSTSSHDRGGRYTVMLQPNQYAALALGVHSAAA
jgi:hypothetical protein